MSYSDESDDQVSTQNVLSVSGRGKGIPYGGRPRSDGQTNHGFILLKGNIEAVSDVPEAMADEHLRRTLRRINGPECAFWSIGCVSGLFYENPDKSGQTTYSGYVEFAFNDDLLFASADNYFRLYFQFNNECRSQTNKIGTSLHWELAPSTIIGKGKEGWTCAIFLQTRTFPAGSEDATADAWGRSLEVITNFLVSLSIPTVGNRLY